MYSCKQFVEKRGDSVAQSTIKHWQREKCSLAEVIEKSLIDYADVYEKCTAVRLFFENEKADFECQVRNFNNNCSTKNSGSNNKNYSNQHNCRFAQSDEDARQSSSYSRLHNSNYCDERFSKEEYGGGSKKRKTFEEESVENKENNCFEPSPNTSLQRQRKMKKFNSPLKDI